MSDESALRNALGAYPEKHGQGDNAALKSALNDLKYTVRQSVYNTPYPNTPAPSAPKPTTPPTQPTTTPTQTAGAVQPPASVSGAPQVTYAPNVTPPQAEPQDFFQSLESKTDAGIDTVAGLLGTDTSNPFARVGGFLLGAGQQVLGAAGDIAGTVGQGINAADEAAIRAQQAIRGEGYDAPLPSNYIKPTDAFANLAGAYNEGLQQPIAGIGGKVMGALGETLFPAYKNKDADTARLTAPTPDVQQTINDTFAAIGRGDIAGALGNVLASLQQYGNQQYEEIEKVDPLGALAASLVLDPLNFVPGMGVGKAQQAGKLAEITRDVGRIENVADLAPKGVMGRIMTPAAKVTETVKSALQNIGLRTQYADNAEELFGNYRRFMKAGEDAKGFAKVVEEMAGMASVPAQRAQRLVQGMGKEVDTIEQAYRTMETALRGADELTDVSKLPKTFQNFIKDVRAGTASADDALDVLKAEMATRTSKYFAEQGAKLFPVKGMAAPVKVADRFMNELRGFESLVYIGLSPFTFVRNVINGVSTMAIEGLNPLFDASREIERLTKLGQVSKAKELERAIGFQKVLMETSDEVRKAMGLGSYGTGATGYFGNFMSNMIHGTPLGKPLQWYRQMENAMRARVWSQTYYRALQHNWDVGKFIPEMDAVTQAVLHQYRVDPQKIMDIVREAGVHDKKGVATEVLKYLRGERAGALDVERLAGEMGLSKQQLLSFLDEHDVAKAQSMAQEIAAQVANGKHPAQAVNDVVGQAAKETADEVIARTGAQAPEAAQTGMSLQELEQRRGELVAQWAAASKTRGGRKIADDLAAEIDAVEREIERMGYTGEKSFESAPDVAQAAQNVAPETAQETAQAAQEAGTIPLPEDLRFSQFASEWDAMTDPQRELMIGLERAKQTPMQVGVNEVLPQVADTYQAAGDVPTLMPDVTTGVPAPKEAPPTLGDVTRAAHSKGIATAEETTRVLTRGKRAGQTVQAGDPISAHLLNVLNNHAEENGVAKFANMADVQARAEEALKILDAYTPSGNAPASVQKAVDELKNVIDPEGIKRQEIEWLKQRGSVPPSAGDMAKLPETPNAPQTPPSAPKEAWQMTREDVVWEGYIPDGLGTDKALKGRLARWEKIKREAATENRNIEVVDKAIESEKARIARANSHRVAVEKALSEGKPVPAEVLADYPDLAAKYAPAPAQAAPEAVGKKSASQLAEEIARKPRHELPANLSQNVADAATEYKFQLKQGEPGKRISYYNQEEGGRVFMAQGSTNPDWYGKLVEKYKVNKGAVEAALNKIIKDNGIDKGVNVERLKEMILQDLADGLQTQAGKMPPDWEARALLGYSQDQIDEAFDLYQKSVDNVPEVGTNAAAQFGDVAKPQQGQGQMFTQGEDSPLFSGTPQAAKDAPFQPKEVGQQGKMFSTAPEFKGAKQTEPPPAKAFNGREIVDEYVDSKGVRHSLQAKDGDYAIYSHGRVTSGQYRTKGQRHDWLDFRDPNETKVRAQWELQKPKTAAPLTVDRAPTAEQIVRPGAEEAWTNAVYGEIQKQIDAAEEIARLRQIATEDPQAASILSRDEMLKAKARTQADMYEALMRVYNSEPAARVRVGTDAENRVMAWLRRDVFNGMDESRAAAQVAADWMDNAVMISRDGETHFDSALNWLSPFQFWGTRYALQSARRVADKPARLMWYLKLRDMQDQVENDPRFPKRLRGMMTLPFPGAPKWAGSMWFDPLETFTQIESVFKMNQFDNALTDSDVAGAIRALVESGRVSPSEAANAIANKSGALWDATKAQMEEATKRQEGLDSITTAFKPHMPFDIIWKLRTGNAADIGVLFPMTRLIRNTTSLAPQGSFLNPTGTGINIEQPIKAGLRALTGNQSIPDWDQWEQYRVDRALADMVGDGTISERDALIAMIERKGGWYDEAQRRAQEQMRTQNFTSVFGGQMFPQGEQEYYKARVLKDQLINQAVAQLGGNPNDLSYGEKMELIRANGLNKKGTPLGDFYDQNPVYNARGDAYAEPEERLKGFLTDEVWQKYLALSALDKRMARQGNKDLAAFITNPERDYKAVTLEKAAEWVKYLRGYLPEAEQTPKVGALNQIQFAPPDLAAAYQTMQDEQKTLFNLDAMQPRMDARAKMTPNEKRAFDAANPDVAAYYKWYGQKMKENPALAKLIHPDTQNNYAANYNQQATNNYLTDQVVKHLNRMVGKLDDSRARRFNPNSRSNKPRPLSRSAVMALQQKRMNPNYYLPREVYRELIAAFKASGLRMAFEQWLQMMAAQGGV